MNSTKKMPSSLGKDGQLDHGSEFVIPHPAPGEERGFYGIRTGKAHARAAITFVGRAITADDVISKIQRPIEETENLRKRIDDFFDQLQAFKIGNVISISYAGDGEFTLKREATQPPPSNKKPLP